MSDHTDPKTYSLEPPTPPGGPAPADAAPAASNPASATAPASGTPTTPSAGPQPKAKLDAPALLADFPEDADFDRDPVREAVVRGPRVEHAAQTTTLGPPLVGSTLGGPQVWAIVGGLLLVSALVATAINAPNRAVIRVLLVLYNTLLHTGTGVAALTLAAMLLQRRLGPVEAAAARMFAAVSAFVLVAALPTTLFGVRWADVSLGLILAAGVYVLAVASLFGLWRRLPLAYVVLAHAILWLIVQVGVELAARVAAPA